MNKEFDQSNTAQARRLAEEVVRRDGTRLTEALLADAIGHLADEVERLWALLPNRGGGYRGATVDELDFSARRAR